MADLQEVTLEEEDGGVTRKSPFVVTQSYTRSYNVIFDQAGSRPSVIDVLTATGLPIVNYDLFEPSPGYVIPYCVCTNKRAKRISGKSKYAYRVTCEFSTDGEDEQQPVDSAGIDPLAFQPRIEPYVEKVEFPFPQDWDGEPIVNPLGELYSEPVMFPIPCGGVRLTRYLPSFDETILEYWLESTNDGTWRGQPEDSWLIRGVTGTEVKWSSVLTVGQLTFDIISCPITYAGQRVGWKASRARVATHFIVSTPLANAGDKVRFTLDDGSWKGIGLVDEDGEKITGIVPEYDFYRTRRQRDFDLLLS